MADGFSSPDVQATIDAITALTTGLAAALAPENATIVAGSYSLAAQDYTPKLGPLWKIVAQEPPPVGTLAQINYDGNDYRIIGYEFGTRAHRIPVGGNANPVLSFEWQGGQVAFAWVQHPGAQAHNKLPEFQADVETLAEAVWTTALATLFDAL